MQAQIWPITVATAAPATPMSNTKMKMGSRMMLIMAPAPWVYMERMLCPVPCSSRSSIIWPKAPAEQPMTIMRYWLPIWTISSTSVWLRKKKSERVSPSTAHTAKPTSARNRPFMATASAP